MTRTLISILGAVCLFTLPACQHEAVSDGSSFAEEGIVRSPQRFADIQAAAGARSDAMLTQVHFSGSTLNSLGIEKLDRMIADDDLAEPMVVYLNVPQDQLVGARTAAVETYLADCGLQKQQIAVQVGVNEQTLHLASISSARLYQVGDGGLVNVANGQSDSAAGGQSSADASGGQGFGSTVGH